MSVSVASTVLSGSNLVLTLDSTGQPTSGTTYNYALSLGSAALSNMVSDNGSLY
jgi:hypothetical protein